MELEHMNEERVGMCSKAAYLLISWIRANMMSYELKLYNKNMKASTEYFYEDTPH